MLRWCGAFLDQRRVYSCFQTRHTRPRYPLHQHIPPCLIAHAPVMIPPTIPYDAPAGDGVTHQSPEQNLFPNHPYTPLRSSSDREPPNLSLSLEAAPPTCVDPSNAHARKTPPAHSLRLPSILRPSRVADTSTRPAIPGASQSRSASSGSTRYHPRRPCPCPARSPSTASAQG